jgi:uncharacterized membrane protein
MGTTSISGKEDPVVRPIAIADVVEALAKGARDLQKLPGYGLVLGAVCTATGLAILACLNYVDMPYFAYPIGTGFALVCPFLAAGAYEVSRRVEAGQAVSWGEIWRSIKGKSEIRWLGFLTLFILIMWMYQIRLLMALFLGFTNLTGSLRDFFTVVLTTNEGLWFLLVGHVAGAILATILFSLTAISFPLVLDRDVDVITAMITSVRAVARNPWPMLAWAAIIAVLLAVSSLPFFLGLVVTVPLLGHATWHLYRRVVAPAGEAA